MCLSHLLVRGYDLFKGAVWDALEPLFVSPVLAFVGVPRWALWLVHSVRAWSVVGRSGTLFGRSFVGGSSCSIQLGRSVHVRSAIEEIFPFLACVPLLSRMLGSCHLVDEVASHGLCLHFLSGLSVWRWGTLSRGCRLLDSVHPVTVCPQRSSVNDPCPNHNHHYHHNHQNHHNHHTGVCAQNTRCPGLR